MCKFFNNMIADYLLITGRSRTALTVFYCSLVICVVFLTSCSSTKITVAKQQQQEMESALTAVTSAVAGREMTAEDLKKLEKNLRDDPEARDAAQAVANALAGEEVRVKYCPETGKRYAPNLTHSPDCGVELKWVE